MNPCRLVVLLFALAAVFSFGGCAQYATVTEIKPQRAGFERKADEPRLTLARNVAAAESAWRRLDRDPANTEARQDYNFAVARICGTLRAAKLAPWERPLSLGTHTLVWNPHPWPVSNPALYEIIPTDELKIKGSYFDVRETKHGIGAPVVAKRVANQAHEMAATPHFYYAATVVAHFDGSRCVLAIEDPLKRETVRVGRHTFPLAAGFTSPLAMMLVEMKPKKLELPRLLHPAEFAASTRIARLEPFDPNKTVVLVVHGLMDSPATWFPLINRLRADEDIRRNYQFWFFSYPSGYPYPYSAAILRRELDVMVKRHPLRKKMVVIGHSMGGCVSRLLITDSGDRIWNAMFTVPSARMDLSPEQKHILLESNIFAHRSEIGRVIFISSPHRGSNLASNWFGRITTSLVRMPTALLKVGRDEMRYQKHAAGELHLRRFPDSIDTLAPNNDFVLALNNVPIVKGIPFHTICGDRGRGDTPNSSDGVVPYWSSHLPDAVSEKIVPSHHNAHQNPEAIEEVHRILQLHLKPAGR